MTYRFDEITHVIQINPKGQTVDTRERQNSLVTLNLFTFVCLGIFVLWGCVTQQKGLPATEKSIQAAKTAPIVIAHRGASGYLPEHTLEAYSKAIEMGADFIEPDVVSTKDGVLIARHENELSDTTDVAKKFPKRKSQKKVDGKTKSGWFSEDFTLAEIKTLRAKERLTNRSQKHNGLYKVPTLEEVLELANEKTRERGKAVGVYIETKHPTYFKSVNLALEEKVIEALKKHGYQSAPSRVFIQSFETGNLKELRAQNVPYPLVQLIGSPSDIPFDLVSHGETWSYRSMVSSLDRMKQIATYAHGIGPNKGYVLKLNKDGSFEKVSSIVDAAHAAGLFVHTWTFRAEETAAIHPGTSLDEEILAHLEAGTDGVFTDFPDLGVRGRDAYLTGRGQ